MTRQSGDLPTSGLHESAPWQLTHRRGVRGGHPSESVHRRCCQTLLDRSRRSQQRWLMCFLPLHRRPDIRSNGDNLS